MVAVDAGALSNECRRVHAHVEARPERVLSSLWLPTPARPLATSQERWDSIGTRSRRDLPGWPSRVSLRRPTAATRRPSGRSWAGTPSSGNARLANERLKTRGCVASKTRTTRRRALSVEQPGEPVGKRHRRDPRSQRNRASRRGGHRKARAPTRPSSKTACPTRVLPRRPLVPVGRTYARRRTPPGPSQSSFMSRQAVAGAWHRLLFRYIQPDRDGEPVELAPELSWGRVVCQPRWRPRRSRPT
jgi:hypothetical protein